MAERSEHLKRLLLLVFGCVLQACVHCEGGGEWELVPVVLLEPTTLGCTYNCSEGFIRGTWRSRNEILGCPGCHWTQLNVSQSGDLCTLHLQTKQLMLNDTHIRYTCVICQTDLPGVPCRTQRHLELKITTSLTASNPSSLSTTAHVPSPDATPPPGGFGWVQMLAAVALVIVVVLITCLCVLGSKRMCSAASEEVPVVGPDRPGSDKDYASVAFISTDCKSEHEVAYADIMISVRGVSTPELRGLAGTMGAQGGVPSNLRAKWREDSGPSPLHHAFHSADRLHVQPREVSRKLSSTSEYAIITYSTDADL